MSDDRLALERLSCVVKEARKRNGESYWYKSYCESRTSRLERRKKIAARNRKEGKFCSRWHHFRLGVRA